MTNRAHTLRRLAAAAAIAMLAIACGDDDVTTGPDYENEPRAQIDRFSDAAATLFRRSAMPSLPAANAAIDLDAAPFVTQGFGPDGQVVRYYNFDRQPSAPAPIYVLYREGENQPVSGQANIVDAIPGDAGYSDFWRVVRVTVPSGYVANTIRSRAEIVASGYAMDETDAIVNCPIVPEGSHGDEGDAADGLTTGWYRDQVVFYFNFGAPLTITDEGEVPIAPIFVSFNVNPDEPNGGPASGFRTEPGTAQTHNVVASIPGQPGYSPYWAVIPYDNAEFANVLDLASAQVVRTFGIAAFVNCPIVFVDQ